MSNSRLMSLRLLVLGGLHMHAAAAVPAHMQFIFDTSGVIQMKNNKDLRLNVKGGDLKHGDPIVLWTEQEENHEQFTEENGFIKLKTNPGMCLNIEGGLSVGHNLVTWPCGESTSAHPNEQFQFAKGGRIHPKSDSNLCLNVKAADFQPGAEIVLWKCEGSGHAHELFKQDGSRIHVLNHPELHFNVAGGDISTPGAKVVLYNDHPSTHEVFEIFEGRIHLKQHTELCLNAEGGLSVGHRIVLWPCSPVPAENELFHLDKATGAIVSSRMPELAFNAAGGGMNLGDEIVLWNIKEEL